MPFITVEILFIFILMIINGVFAMSEIAVVSSRKARLQQRAESGDRRARLALELSNSPEEFLATVQVGITLVGVLAGAFGGATIAQKLSADIATIPVLMPYAGTIALAIVVVLITYLTLIIGELFPKRFALNNPERIAALIAGPMRVLARLTSPIVWLLTISTKALVWLFRIKPSTEPPITEDEINILVEQGVAAGVIHEDEGDIIERVFRLGARRVSTLMTPRMDLVVLYVSDSPEKIRQKISASGHTLFPLCEGTIDNVLGVVRTQDVLVQILDGESLDLKALVVEPLFLPEPVQSLKLLDEFKETGKDTAFLLDEYGVFQGLVTATDVLRALVGEVSHITLPKAERGADGSLLMDGMLPIDEFKRELKLDQLPDEESLAFETAGGFLLTLLDRIPSAGDLINWEGYRFEVLEMDEFRIDRILITPIKDKKTN